MVGMGAAHRLLDWALRDHGEFDVFGLLIRHNRLGGSVAEVTRTIADLGERRITLHVLREGVDTATPTGARRASICSPMSGDIGVDAVDPNQRGREQESVMVGEMPVERSAQLILLLYLDKRGRPKARIHGRPRSDRKRRFLLSAVAPSTSTRHPREARPINWAQRGGLASGQGNVS